MGKEKILSEGMIDTTELKINFSNMNNLILEDELFESKCIKKERDSVKEQTKNVVINLHMITGKYIPIRSLKEYKDTMKGLLEGRMGVINSKEVKMNRVDIAIDLDMDYRDSYKMILFFFALYTESAINSEKEKEQLGSMWSAKNLRTLKESTLRWSNQRYEACFYDKKEESKGRHDFGTRFEFRFKKLSTYSFEKNINKVIDNLKNIENNIEIVEDMFIENLIESYNFAKKTGETRTFSEFVRNNNKYFFTKRVIQEVYKTTGLKGNFTNWFKDFKKGNSKLEYYKKTDVTKFKKVISNALKELKKS